MAPMTKTPNPIDVHVGSRVRLRRSMAKMSQEKLGDALGVTFQQIQKYEKGVNRIGASRLQKISETLNVPIAFFFEDAPGSVRGDDLQGMEEAASASFVTDFLSSNEGIELNTAFVRITNPAIRRRIIDMVKVLADEAGGES